MKEKPLLDALIKYIFVSNTHQYVSYKHIDNNSYSYTKALQKIKTF